jgi:hypothetical protein
MIYRPFSTKFWRNAGLVGVLAAVGLIAGEVLGVEEPTLRDRLEKGLYARTNADFAFLDRVVERVDADQLPEKLVNRVFFWARKKADSQDGGRRRRPMIYFRPAMTILAGRMGVDLE